jgi:Ni/Fe-hydrogenase 1 B-type cytochrome subunit
MHNMNSAGNSQVSDGTEVPGFNEPHSAAIRIWHWVFFLTLTASLITVLFGSTLFRTRNTIGLVEEPLQQKGVSVTKDQARAVAHEFSDQLWNLHTLIGYVLCGLLLARILIEILQPREEKLGDKLRKAAGFTPVTESDRSEKRHYLRVKRTYLIFYLSILTMAMTGLGLAFEDNPLLKAWRHNITAVHQFVQYFIYGFILLHLAGVIRADLYRHKGLVSRMVHGKKQVKV